MKFITEGSSVICLRETTNSFKEVVRFDKNLSEVAPHVEGALYAHEVDELNTWLDARENLETYLESLPEDLVVVEVLPCLLREANASLRSHGKVDLSLKSELLTCIKNLNRTLDEIVLISDPNIKRKHDNLSFSEIIKTKLDTLKNILSDSL